MMQLVVISMHSVIKRFIEDSPILDMFGVKEDLLCITVLFSA